MQAEVAGKVGQFAVSKQRDKFILRMMEWQLY